MSEEKFVFIQSFFDSFRYVINTSLGHFETDVFDNGENVNKVLCWIILILCQFISMIVMLNLLIAIIGDKYNTVTEKATAYMFKQRASSIVKVQNIIPIKYLREEIAHETPTTLSCKKLMLVAKDMADDFEDANIKKDEKTEQLILNVELIRNKVDEIRALEKKPNQNKEGTNDANAVGIRSMKTMTKGSSIRNKIPVLPVNKM
jgi:hypothetical protein